MIKIRVDHLGDSPSVAIRTDGGVLAWQDWMCDSIALLGTGRPGQVALFSFTNGSTLETGIIPGESLDILATGQHYSLLSDDLGPDLRYEGLIRKNEPFEATGAFFKGIQCQTHGDLGSAVTIYQELQQTQPILPRVANLLGLCLRVSQRLPEAEQAYLKEIEIAPQFPDVYCNLGILYLKTGREHLARTMFEKALDRDQFHLNSLLQWSKFLKNSGEGGSKIAASVNVRLFNGYPEVPQVQEHLTELAAAQGISLQQLGMQFRAGAGPLAEPKLMNLMKRVENLRLNGALIAALRGYSHILRKAGGTSMEGFFHHWVRKRMAAIDAVRPKFLDETWNDLTLEIMNEHPVFAKSLQEASTSAPTTGNAPPAPSPDSEPPALAPLTPEEFFAMTLEEVMRDGQIKPEETNVVCRLKNLLRIDEAAHTSMFNEAVARARGNPLADDGGSFDSHRLFKRLVLAVVRDGKVEPHEKKLLSIASEALELSSQEVKALIAEVQKR